MPRGAGTIIADWRSRPRRICRGEIGEKVPRGERGEKGRNGRIGERGLKRGLKGVREMLQKNEWRKEYLFKKKES